jgi:hypothetical protein
MGKCSQFSNETWESSLHRLSSSPEGKETEALVIMQPSLPMKPGKYTVEHVAVNAAWQERRKSTCP